MVFTCPFISKSSSLHSDCTKSTTHDWYDYHLHVSYFFFQFLRKGRDTYLSFDFRSVLFCGQAGQQSPQFFKFFFFFFDYYKIWSSDRAYVICFLILQLLLSSLLLLMLLLVAVMVMSEIIWCKVYPCV